MQARADADDAAWDRMLTEIAARQRQGLTEMRVLVYSAGGKPTNGQRQRLMEAVGGMRARTALLTNYALARFVGWTIGLLTGRLKSFRADQIEVAFDYLGLQPKEREFARQTMAELAAEVGVTWRPDGP